MTYFQDSFVIENQLDTGSDHSGHFQDGVALRPIGRCRSKQHDWLIYI